MKAYWDITPYHLSYGKLPDIDPTPVPSYSVPVARRGSHYIEQTLAIIHGINELGFNPAVAFEFEHSLGTSRFTLAPNKGHNVWLEEPLDWTPEER